nr:MAG TPA: hypothetical protein [Caudoviricetes sp.]
MIRIEPDIHRLRQPSRMAQRQNCHDRRKRSRLHPRHGLYEP